MILSMSSEMDANDEQNDAWGKLIGTSKAGLWLFFY